MAKEFYNFEFVRENTHKTPTRYSFEDITGEVYSKVKVIGWAGLNKYGDWKKARNVWWCKCSCNNTEYFLVDKHSLKKGLTTSCGCNYKNNRGGHEKQSLKEAGSTLDSRYQLLEYNGRRGRCKLSCSKCEDVVEESSFYSVLQKKIVCSCKSKEGDTYLINFLKGLSYTLERRLEGDSGAVEISCNSCGMKYTKTISTIKRACPCHTVEGYKEGYSAVYLLRDENDKSLFKIGKADDPYQRISTIQKSCDDNDYNHKWRVEGVKWFGSKHVAFNVEHLYHKEFKDKNYYGYKTDKLTRTVFDGSGEVFKLSKEDFTEFNRKHATTLKYLEKVKPKFHILEDYRRDTNQQWSKGCGTGVSVWFPDKTKKFSYMKLKFSTAKEDMFKEGQTLYQIYKNIKSYERKLKVIIDNITYESYKDFYDQHRHLSAVTFSHFQDRVYNKSMCVWDALVSHRKRKKRGIYQDVDGTQTTCMFLYNKYKPLIGFTAYKDKLLEGGCPKELAQIVPENSMTKVYLVGGKYYSNTALWDTLSPAVIKSTFYTRLERNWCPIVAACVPQISGGVSKGTDLVTLVQDLEKYNKLQNKMGVG